MYLGVVDKVETTTDKNVANALLDKGWVLLEVVVTFKKEFLWCMGRPVKKKLLFYGGRISHNHAKS